MKNSINIVLLGLDFNSGNFGCSALGYSFLNILKNIAEKNDIHMRITSVNYHNFSFESPNLNVENLQIKYKSISFYNKYIKKIKSADLVYDFTGGDSFTDIYGHLRFYKETFLKALVIIFKKKLIIGPQTIGPFNNKIIHYIAKKIMSKSYKNYTRDNISKQFVEDMNIPITQVTDIAFLLPKSDDYVTKIEKNAGKKISLHIYGQGPLKDLVIENQMKDNRIEYNGQLNAEELKKEYIKNDVLIVPSIWEEPFGRVVIEANQYGLPVIGANRAGIKEIIETIKTGELYQYDSQKDLIEKINLLSNRDNIKRYFSNIKNNINFYSIENQINQFTQIYKSII